MTTKCLSLQALAIKFVSLNLNVCIVISLLPPLISQPFH